METFKKIFIYLLLFVPLFAEEFEGKVISVMDGDTIKVLVNSRQIKVRLFGIDAPERKQAYGKQSEKTLKSLVWKKQVKVQVKDTDQYGRIVGVVFLNDLNVNLEMVRRGMAWVYRDFNRDETYLEAEAIARKSEVGLWREKDPTPPWIFRKNEKLMK